MMEGAEGTLHEHIKQRIRDGNAPRMPLKASLPILVDLLRGIIDLEELPGLLHKHTYTRFCASVWIHEMMYMCLSV